jgi:ribosome-binding factor A
MQSTRIARVAQEMQQEIAMIIHQELKDPGLGFVTITRVELSSDLRYGKVMFSCLGTDQEREQSQDVLNRSARYIHGLLKKRFRLKAIPELTFKYDESIQHSLALERTLEKLKDEDKPQA